MVGARPRPECGPEIRAEGIGKIPVAVGYAETLKAWEEGVRPLDVQTRKAYSDNGRRYLVYRGTLRNGRSVAVIWRETKGWTQEDYERDRNFVADGVDEIFVNGDSLIPGAQSLDPICKARMFAGVEG